MKFFRNIYLAIFKWYVLFLIGLTTRAVFKLMVSLGKDPNYVPPPPPEYTPPNFDDMDINRGWMVDPKARPNIWDVTGGDYVRNPAQHPLLRIRGIWEEQQKKAKKVAENVGPTVVDSENETEVGSKSIASVIVNVEQTKSDPDKKPE